jgi:hypothetical protein
LARIPCVSFGRLARATARLAKISERS